MAESIPDLRREPKDRAYAQLHAYLLQVMAGIDDDIAGRIGADRDAGDHDREAVAQARVNAHNNDVIAQFIDTQKPLSLQADLVVANILAIPLKVLAPLLASHCRSGGRIALAGLLDEQADDVAAAYAPWFDMAVYASAEGWTALEGERR